MLGEILKSRERKCRVLCHPFDDEWSHSKSAPTLSRVFSKWKGNFFKKEEEKSREFIDFKEQLTFLVILRVNYIKSIKSIWCSWLCFFFFSPYLSTILEQQPDPLHLYTFSLSSDDEGGAKRQLKTEGQRTTLHPLKTYFLHKCLAPLIFQFFFSPCVCASYLQSDSRHPAMQPTLRLSSSTPSDRWMEGFFLKQNTFLKDKTQRSIYILKRS